MAHARIVPWHSSEEWEQLKTWFYSDSTKEQRRAILKVNSYQCRGSQYLPHVIDSTCQLTNALLLDEDNNVEKLSVRLNYTMSLIRFVNGILDPNQKAQFAIPLHTIARNVGLSSWFVELRHWGTHERELPSLDMLRIAVRDALNWLWIHYWDANELEDSQDEEDDEEGEGYGADDQVGSMFPGVDVQTIRQLLNGWNDEVSTLFKENKRIWISRGDEENTLKKVISSDNFIVDTEPTKNNSNNSNNKKIQGPNRKQLKIEQEINEYIKLWKDQWGHNENKKGVIELVMNHFNSSLLTMLISQLDSSFTIEYFRWLLNNYKLVISPDSKNKRKNKQKIPSTFKHFRDINDLLKYMIKKMLKLINVKQMISEYELWLDIFDETSTFHYKMIGLILLKLNNLESQENDDWRNKKYKKRKLNGKDNKQTKFKAGLIEKLNKYGNSDEIKEMERIEKNTYQETLFPQPLGTNAIEEVKKPILIKPIMDPLDILNDIKLLKGRLNENTNASSVKASERSSPKKSWTRPLEWTPKPFGVL